MKREILFALHSLHTRCSSLNLAPIFSPLYSVDFLWVSTMNMTDKKIFHVIPLWFLTYIYYQVTAMVTVVHCYLFALMIWKVIECNGTLFWFNNWVLKHYTKDPKKKVQPNDRIFSWHLRGLGSFCQETFMPKHFIPVNVSVCVPFRPGTGTFRRRIIDDHYIWKVIN